MKTMQKLFAMAVLALLLAGLGPRAEAQGVVGPGYTKIQQVQGMPWQFGGDWKFNSASTSSTGFDLRGISYYRVLWVPVGTMGSCALSIDSAAAVDPVLGTLVSPTTGGVLSAATIGSCVNPGEYVTTIAAGITAYGQITPTIVGTGSVIVVVFGYTDNPSAGGVIGGSVAITNFPSIFPSNNFQTAEATAAWSSATSLNSVVAQTITGLGSTIVTLNQGSTITGGAVSFEASDTLAGTNWYAIQAVQTNGFVTGISYTLAQSTNQAWDVDVAGWVQVRVRLSTAITGTGTVNVGIATNASASVSDLSAAVTNTVATQPSGFGTLIGFQQAVTASAVALSANASHSFCVTALPSNTINIYVGPAGVTTSTGTPLAPGQAACFGLNNTNLVFVIAGSTGASVAISGV